MTRTLVITVFVNEASSPSRSKLKWREEKLKWLFIQEKINIIEEIENLWLRFEVSYSKPEDELSTEDDPKLKKQKRSTMDSSSIINQQWRSARCLLLGL